MKNCNHALHLAFLVLSLLSYTHSFSQSDGLAYVKAQNCVGFYHTVKGDIFTWSGPVQNNYCHGYGTVQWFDSYGARLYRYTGNVQYGKNEGYGTSYYSNGVKAYEGYWKNDMREGAGTSFYDDGTIQYKGNFVNGSIEHLSDLNEFAYNLGNYLMQNIFDGGIHLDSRVIKMINAEGEDKEIRIKVSFNGDIVTTNYYEFTIVIRSSAPYVDLVNVNDMASFYAGYKLSKSIVDYYNEHADGND